jgi:cytochrome b pre-mRNA-processing protein 3
MFASLRKLLVNREAHARAQAHYIACVTQARHPYFYTTLGVPDTLDGRFEMVLLHVHLLLVRGETTLSADEKRLLVEAFFADMEHNIREFGIDMGMKKRIRAMADAYNGRMTSYATATSAHDNALLVQALSRNVYGAENAAAALHAETLAAYVWQALAQPVLREASVTGWPEPASMLAA